MKQKETNRVSHFSIRPSLYALFVRLQTNHSVWELENGISWKRAEIYRFFSFKSLSSTQKFAVEQLDSRYSQGTGLRGFYRVADSLGPNSPNRNQSGALRSVIDRFPEAQF